MRIICNSRFWTNQYYASLLDRPDEEYLETFILQHPLDRCIFAIGSKLCLKHHTERSIAHYLALGVLHLSCLACQAILHLLPDDLYNMSA